MIIRKSAKEIELMAVLSLGPVVGLTVIEPEFGIDTLAPYVRTGAGLAETNVGADCALVAMLMVTVTV